MKKQIIVTLGLLGFMNICHGNATLHNYTAFPVKFYATFVTRTTNDETDLNDKNKGITLSESEANKKILSAGDALSSAELWVDYYSNGDFVKADTVKDRGFPFFVWYPPQDLTATSYTDKDGNVKAKLIVS